MDSSTLERNLKEYEEFLRNCKLVEEEVLPQHETEIVWKNLEFSSQFKQLKTVKLESRSHIQADGGPTRDQKKCPFLDVTWSIEMELLPVIDDGTISQNYQVPLERAQALSSVNFPSKGGQSDARTSEGPKSDSPQSSETGSRDRLKALRAGISRRLRGLRSSEHSRSLQKTLQRDPDNPECVLLAVVKWDGPSQSGFSVIGATVKIGFQSLTATDPFAAHSLSENSFALESSSSLQWTGPGHGRRRQSAVGVKTLKDWISSFPNSLLPQPNGNSVTLWLTIKLNELSIPRIGFPFALFLVTDKEEFEETMEGLRRGLPEEDEDNQHVVVEAPNGETFCLLKEDLSKSSAYFRAFLTENWEHSRGDGSSIQFPLVAPLNTCPDLIALVVYFMARKSLFFGLSENAADLIVVADALGMPGLMRLAEVAAAGNITLENVTQLVRLAWQFQADLLFRAALIFLRANYDEIWLKNRQDLADLGQLLSDDKFQLAFKMESAASNRKTPWQTLL